MGLKMKKSKWPRLTQYSFHLALNSSPIMLPITNLSGLLSKVMEQRWACSSTMIRLMLWPGIIVIIRTNSDHLKTLNLALTALISTSLCLMHNSRATLSVLERDAKPSCLSYKSKSHRYVWPASGHKASVRAENLSTLQMKMQPLNRMPLSRISLRPCRSYWIQLSPNQLPVTMTYAKRSLGKSSFWSA